MKYLIYIGPGIGDWIITLPMARRIKLNDSGAHITTLTCSNKKRFGLNKTLFELQEWIDEIHYYCVSEPLHDVRLLLDLGIKSYDYYFKFSYFDNPYISNWPNRIMKLAAQKGVGVHLANKPNLTYEYEVPFKASNNVYDTPLELLEKIGINKHSDEIQYHLLDVEKTKQEFHKLDICKDKKIIAIIPGTAGAPVTADGKNGTKPAKSWPLDNWNELARRLVNDGYAIVLLGGKAEQEDIMRSHLFRDESIINLCGTTSIIESCSVLCHSIIAVGGDTGMMHCAGAVGTLSLTLFGCTDYQNYLAYGDKSYYIASKKECSPCFGGEGLLSCDDFQCMKDIKVEEVYCKIISIISD